MKLFKEKGVLYNVLDPVTVLIVLLLLLYSAISQGIIPVGQSAPKKAPVEKEVSLPKTYTVEGIWKVTVASVEFLPGKKNLRFNLLVENLQDEPAEFFVYDRDVPTYILDNLGNEYQASLIAPLGKRKFIQNMPVKVQITFSELKEGAETVVLYLRFWGAGIKEWKEKSRSMSWYTYKIADYKELVLEPIKLEKVPLVEERLEEVSLPIIFVTQDSNWSITIDSYEFPEERKIQFTLLIENLQDESAECVIDKKTTHLLDNLANEYYNPELSIEGYEKFVPRMPMKILVTFPELKEGVEAVVLYLRFSPGEGAQGDWAIGPIKLEEWRGTI